MRVAARHIATLDELVLVERWFGDPDPDVLVQRYTDALEALKDSDVEAWLEDASRMGVDAGIADRFRRDWLGGARVPGLDPDVMKSRLAPSFTDTLSARDARLPLSIVLVLNNDEPDTSTSSTRPAPTRYPW